MIKEEYPLGDTILDLALTVFPALDKESKELFLRKILRLYLEEEEEKPDKIREIVNEMVFTKVVKK